MNEMISELELPELKMVEEKKENINWNEYIEKELLQYLVEDEESGHKFVLLHGLRLAAAKRGYRTRTFDLLSSGENIIIKCKYVWNDFSVDEGIADCNESNAPGEPFGLYKSVIAYNRAEAVTIRTALKINYVSVEELKNGVRRKKQNGHSNKGISEQQKVAINNLIKKYEVSFDDVLNKSEIQDKEFSDIRQEQFVKVLDNLSEEQGTKILQFLSSLSNDKMARIRKSS